MYEISNYLKLLNYKGVNNMNTASKISKSESYSPNEEPEIITAVRKSSSNKYETYKNIELRMDYIELQDSLKFAGVPYSVYPNFANIDKYHDEYKSKMMDRYAPYTEVGAGYSCANTSGWDYIFGCQITNMDEIPEGLICFDTGVRRFAVITFRANSVQELVGGENGAGDAMVKATEYIKEVWLPKHMKEVNIVDLKGLVFEITFDDMKYHMNPIEIYKVELKDDPEMCYYIPLK